MDESDVKVFSYQKDFLMSTLLEDKTIKIKIIGDFTYLDYSFVGKWPIKTFKEKEEGLKMLTETLKSLCIDNCKDGSGCYRLFTCDSWPNSKLYAVGPKKIWFDRQGKPKVKDSGNYDLVVCESYCNRKRNPWREVKTLEEVRKLYV